MSNEQPKEYYTQGQLQQILDVVRENAVYDDGDFYFKVDGDKITNAVRSLEPTRSRPHTPAPAPPTDETIAALISENARIGSELKRMTEKAERLSGEHDAAIKRKAREQVLDELTAWRRNREQSDEDCAAGWIDEDVFIESLRRGDAKCAHP